MRGGERIPRRAVVTILSVVTVLGILVLLAGIGDAYLSNHGFPYRVLGSHSTPTKDVAPLGTEQRADQLVTSGKMDNLPGNPGRYNRKAHSKHSDQTTAITPPSSPTRTRPDPAYKHGYPMVAFGDSTLALAPTITRPESFNGCRHYVDAWPDRVSRALHLTLADLSCSGTRTFAYWKQPRATFLGTDTKLVVLSYGSNDLRIVSNLTLFEMLPGTSPYKPAATKEDVEKRLRRIVADIRERAPNATIITVGYLPFMKFGTCPAMANVTPVERDHIHQLRREADEILSEVAEGPNIYNVPLRQVSGHDLCSGPNSFILNGQKGVRYHYTLAGTGFIANEVEFKYRAEEVISSLR